MPTYSYADIMAIKILKRKEIRSIFFPGQSKRLAEGSISLR